MCDPYLYPNTDILKNKHNIMNEKDLSEMEAEYTSTRLKQIAEKPLQGNYDFKHLCEIHRWIFQDLYDWAGQTRVINIEKPEPVLGGISIEYSEVQDIETTASSVLSKMKTVNWEAMTLNVKAETLSKYMAELWKVHPFRDGNTRAVVTFFCQFANVKGFALDTELLARNSVYLRAALVAATAVFKDIGDKSNIQYLIKIVTDAIEKGRKTKQIQIKAKIKDKTKYDDIER